MFNSLEHLCFPFWLKKYLPCDVHKLIAYQRNHNQARLLKSQKNGWQVNLRQEFLLVDII